MLDNPKDDELENNDDEKKDELIEEELLIQDELNQDIEWVAEKIDSESGEETDEEVNNTINFDESESDLDVYFKYNTNNHKLEGKHSLKRDTILNGRVVDNDVDDSLYMNFGLNEIDYYETGDIPIEKGSLFEEESKKGDDLLNKRKLAEDVYKLLRKNTELDFKANRRKPNKAVFNNYYKMLLDNIDKQYSKSEIFVELSYYFTDNIFNMYKLLDKKYATAIIMELREKGHLNNLNSITFM